MIVVHCRFAPHEAIFIHPERITKLHKPSTTQLWVEGYDACLQISETPQQVAKLVAAWNDRKAYQKATGYLANFVEIDPEIGEAVYNISERPYA